MRLLTLAVLSTTLMGCSPVFKVKEKNLTCGEPYIPWDGALVNHIQQGDGDGQFDYAPADPLIDRVYGNFDLTTGDFWFYEEFTGEDYRAENHMVGYGTVWDDGDMDILYDQTSNLEDDSSETFNVREIRLGCEVSRRTELESGAVEILEGTYTGGAFEYGRRQGQFGEIVDSSGTLYSDGSYEEKIRHSKGGTDIVVDVAADGVGEVRTDFDVDTGAYTLQGFWKREIDGQVSASFDYQNGNATKEEWQFTYDSDGYGSGSLSIGNQSCDVTFTKGKCELESCDQGSLNGDRCDLPIEVPAVDILP